MKLIMQRINGVDYLYLESESHYKKVKSQRNSRKITADELRNQCTLDEYGDNFYAEFNIQPKKRKKNAK